MDDKRIEEIVLKVFEKAKGEHASHSRFALSKHISLFSNLSSKTLERAYDKYINKQNETGQLQAESVDLLCQYLGFKNYADYVKNNHEELPTKKNIKYLSLGVIGILLMVLIVKLWPKKVDKNTAQDESCMTWADSIYVLISCEVGPRSKFGTKVEPIDPFKLKNFKKIKVNMATRFFTEDGNPMIWYYKNKDKEIEYFTSPGLHPITEETLRKITPYIIETYVPLHSNNPDSFLNE
ncbi:hypothetical protein PY091_12090 [Muricauda sp. 81s02]|uniref:Uncharacterized protein n=2 Tax=Flagellimonas okinawensis TaxID=3031324 RepID=A0ABT5XQ77_9FLAO|nr:hypothetical protein [[Muricauda] okinawensis]